MGTKPPTDDASQSSEQSEVEEYEVESILDFKKDRKGNISFHIQWVGYDETTWEAEENVADGCPELIHQFFSSKGLDDRGNPIDGATVPSPKKSASKRRKKADEASAAASAKKRASSPVQVESSPKKTRSPQSKRIKLHESPSPSPADVAAAAAAADEPTPTVSLPKNADWTKLVDEVLTMERNADNILLVHLKLKNGGYAVETSADVRVKCPQPLIDFYESHLKFKINEEIDSATADDELAQ